MIVVRISSVRSRYCNSRRQGKRRWVAAGWDGSAWVIGICYTWRTAKRQRERPGRLPGDGPGGRRSVTDAESR